MRVALRCWVIGLASLALAGCASMNEEEARRFQAEMDAYVGKSADELILARGVPTASAALSTGGKVLEYISSRANATTGYSYLTYTPVFVRNSRGGGTWISVHSRETTSVQMARCKLTFQISADNKVLNWRAEGNDCRPAAAQ